MTDHPKVHSTANTAMILGALSLFCCGPFTGVPAIVLGVIARGEIDRSNGQLVGRERATLAIVFGAIGTVLLLTIGALAPRPPQVERSHDAAPSKKSNPFAKARVDCVPSGPSSLNCRVESNGIGNAVLCWDVVVTCGGIRHAAHSCSGVLPPGSVETVSVSTFSPTLTGAETCDSIRVESPVLELRPRVFFGLGHATDSLQERAIRERDPEPWRKRKRWKR